MIDLQDGFKPNARPTVMPQWNKVVAAALISSAKAKGWLVVLVEFSGCGDTTRAIKDACEGAEVKVVKDRNGGAEVIAQELSRIKVSPRRIRVAWINTPYCVLETTQGLAEAYPTIKISVVAKACGDVSNSTATEPAYGRNCLRSLAQNQKNVKISRLQPAGSSMKSGEIFVSANGDSPAAKGLQADLNAAANIGKGRGGTCHVRTVFHCKIR